MENIFIYLGENAKFPKFSRIFSPNIRIFSQNYLEKRNFFIFNVPEH
jgi:hypothetical protein